MEAVLPDGTRLQNWSTSNFAGLHNSEDIKVIYKYILACSFYLFRPRALKLSRDTESVLVDLLDFTERLIFTWIFRKNWHRLLVLKVQLFTPKDILQFQVSFRPFRRKETLLWRKILSFFTE